MAAGQFTRREDEGSEESSPQVVGLAGARALPVGELGGGHRQEQLPAGEATGREEHKKELRVDILHQDQDVVFAGQSGGYINPSNLRQRSFAPLLKHADLSQITFHHLRHTCASLLFQRNVHPKIVQELLSHTSVAITLNTYSLICRTPQSTRWGQP